MGFCRTVLCCPTRSPQRFPGSKKDLLSFQDRVYSGEMFIDESLRPKLKRVTAGYLTFIFRFDDDAPTPQQFEKAYSFLRRKLQREYFVRWAMYGARRRARREQLMRALHRACDHYMRKKLGAALLSWSQWLHARQERMAGAAIRIQRVYQQLLCSLVLKAWHTVALDARKTKEYFERLERGELEEDNDSYLVPPPNTADQVSQLPPRAALKIFSYLDIMNLVKCAGVCRSWKVISQASILWSRMDLFPARGRIDDNVVSRLLRRCRPFLLHLSLRGCTTIGPPAFRAVSECKNLQDLNLSECMGLTVISFTGRHARPLRRHCNPLLDEGYDAMSVMEDQMVAIVAEGCRSLLYLNLAYTNIGDGSLRALARFCLPLQYLSLAYCCKFTDKGLHYLATRTGCRRLLYLDLSGCTQTSVDAFQSIATNCHGLLSLVLNDIPTLTDGCLLPLIEVNRGLQSLSLLGSPHISDATFKAVAKCCKLTSLQTEGNEQMSDDAVRAVCQGCAGLGSLQVVGCSSLTDGALKAVSALRQLRLLNVSDCAKLTDAGLRHLTEGAAAAHLHELNLSNCVRVSDLTLTRLIPKCQSMTHLSLRYCDQLTDAGLELLGNMPALVALDLAGTNIQDQGLAAIGNNSRLKELCISQCIAISDLGLQKFCQRVRDLERLDVSHCRLLSDLGVKNLVFCCRRLTYLNLSGCAQLTDVSAQYLSGVCRYLRIADLSGCVKLGDLATRYLRKGCRQLAHLNMLYCPRVSRHAVLKLGAQLESWQHTSESPPPWFGYDSSGVYLEPVSAVANEERGVPDSQPDGILSAA
ncbi:F-box and leucine-rich repeat protein 13 isoform X3 [Petromyzon marinus]|uniref:F-box and leucine-rich repeat protein 13 isoform X3 n=1 Tax=Petromyzon marinus TaxID=7757 RepID=UPI003F70B857